MDNSNTARPDVLNNISETQMQELERQFDEGDRDGWNTLSESYGWSREQCDLVWDHFSEQVRGGGGSMAGGEGGSGAENA